MSSDLVTAIDIGGARIVCLIARCDALQQNGLAMSELQAAMLGPSVLGIGYRQAIGIRAGQIVDMDAATNSLRETVQMAEDAAGVSVQNVFVSINHAFEHGEFQCKLATHGDTINQGHLYRLMGGAEIPVDREVLHKLPYNWRLDGRRVDNPLGMSGDQLQATVRTVHVPIPPTRALGSCLRRCNLKLEAPIAGPYAAGLACLSTDEQLLGATLIDIGQDVTTLAVFKNNAPLYLDSVPVGGRHITGDIAQCLNVPLAEAERLKTMQGTAMAMPTSGIGNRALSRNNLGQIIQPRLEEMFELLKQRLEKAGLLSLALNRQVVITGGSSQLPGLADMLETFFDCKVRLGVPPVLHGLPADYRNGSLAASMGLIAHAQLPVVWTPRQEKIFLQRRGRVARLWQWLRENF